MLAFISLFSALVCLDALPDVKSIQQASLHVTQPTPPKFDRSFEVCIFNDILTPWQVLVLTFYLIAAAIYILAAVRDADTSRRCQVRSMALLCSELYDLQIFFTLFGSASDFRYPVHLWKDASSRKFRMDTYNHTNSLITTEVQSVLRAVCTGFKN